MTALAWTDTAATSLDRLVMDAAGALKLVQRADGHYVFELEADATIPSDYVMLRHFLGTPDPALEARVARYLRAIQGEHGGWPLFQDGDLDISATVKAYFALKLCGEDPQAPHMARARQALLARGGAARANVFTRFALALFGEVPWRAVPVMPVEIMLLPRWAPFHLSKVSYWSRTVIVPLLILAALKPRAINPRGVHIRELFVTPPEEERRYNSNPTGSRWGDLFLALDTVLQRVDRFAPKGLRRRAIDRALAFIKERLNGIDGLGAIYPAMANVVMAYRALGYPDDHSDYVIALAAVENLVTPRGDQTYAQACLSPVWDTGLAVHALMEAGEAPNAPAVKGALDWLQARQILEVRGDWAERAPTLRPGGWAFQYANDHYPDVDDTAVVAMALHRSGDPAYREAVERAAEWILGMQSANGGWGAFDVDNTHHYLNHIPFADHGALLDPPTADVSARCLGFLAQLGHDRRHPAVARAIAYLEREQEPDGSWFGRWGANYVYGTWSVLVAFNAAGVPPDSPSVRRAVDWLKAHQRADGGWGEDLATYWQHRRGEAKESTASQTAWAVLGLMAAGEIESEACTRGIAWLEAQPREGARWQERLYTGVGFPRVFYLKYHGYAAYFPLWAVARYRRLMARNDRRVEHGI